MPLFTNVDDLMTSWNRLESEADSEAKSPTIQVGQVFVFNSPRRPAPVPHHTTTINSGGCGSGSSSSKLTTFRFPLLFHVVLQLNCRRCPRLEPLSISCSAEAATIGNIGLDRCFCVFHVFSCLMLLGSGSISLTRAKTFDGTVPPPTLPLQGCGSPGNIYSPWCSQIEARSIQDGCG